MRGVKDFLQESRDAMIDYLIAISSPSKDVRFAVKPNETRRTATKPELAPSGPAQKSDVRQ